MVFDNILTKIDTIGLAFVCNIFVSAEVAIRFNSEDLICTLAVDPTNAILKLRAIAQIGVWTLAELL